MIKIKKPTKLILKLAAEHIKKGKLVIYPTETCYGLATNALNANAVKRIYNVKKREKSISVIVSDMKMADKYCKLDKNEKKITRKLMPGALTLVVKKKKAIPDIVSKKTIAFRISSSPIASKLSKYAKVPITATSANLSGESSPYSIKEINPKLKVDLVLDAGRLRKVKPSTIAQIVDNKVKILRKGPVSKKKITALIASRC